LKADSSIEALTRAGVAAALGRKASDLLVLNLSGISSIADYFIICSAASERQCRAIAEAIEEKAKELGQRPNSVEGWAVGRWILLDYGDCLFHVFLDEARRFYALERLWGDAGDETRNFAAAL